MKKILWGNKDAKNRIILFSDTFCGYCRQLFIDLKEKLKGKEDKYVVYMLHFPLESIHPSSKIVSAIIEQANEGEW